MALAGFAQASPARMAPHAQNAVWQWQRKAVAAVHPPPAGGLLGLANYGLKRHKA